MDTMKFTNLVPNVFYQDIHDALDFFLQCLEFKIVHNEVNSKNPFCVIERDGLYINLFENENLAKEHSPEFRLVTDDIEAVYRKVSSTHPHYLHPNLSKITLRPWGALEFALTDKQLGIVVQQWGGRSDS